MTVTILYKTNLLMYLYAANLFKYVTCFLLLSKQCTEIICKSLARKKKGQQVISDRQRAYIYNSWIQKSVSNMRKYISNGFFLILPFYWLIDPWSTHAVGCTNIAVVILHGRKPWHIDMFKLFTYTKVEMICFMSYWITSSTRATDTTAKATLIFFSILSNWIELDDQLQMMTPEWVDPFRPLCCCPTCLLDPIDSVKKTKTKCASDRYPHSLI